MKFLERVADWIDRLSPRYEAPPMDLPEYDRPYIRQDRRADDERAEEALRFLQEWAKGVRSDREREQYRWERRRGPRP